MTIVRKPLISLVVISYNMGRELPRTLKTLTMPYQTGFEADEIEVIVVDNGSSELPDLSSFHECVQLLVVEEPNASPAQAVNLGLQAARADLIGVLIDGARMASPGLCQYALLAAKLHPRPVISTLGFHFGPEIQMRSTVKGYCPALEDKLLDSVKWQEDRYQLFNVSVFAGSSRNGWFNPIAESNALFLSSEMWEELDGFDERFITMGGGLVNHDAYIRACELPDTQLIRLLGEGTFHQVHGGIVTNQKNPAASWPVFKNEYLNIRNKPFARPEIKPLFLGTIPPQISDSMKFSSVLLGK